MQYQAATARNGCITYNSGRVDLIGRGTSSARHYRSALLHNSVRTTTMHALALLIMFCGLSVSEPALHGYSVTHASSSRRALQQQHPQPPPQTISQVFITFDPPLNGSGGNDSSSTPVLAAAATTAGLDSSVQTTAAGAPAETAAASPSPAPPPSPEAAWQQRRSLQLPPHVYLISFVMLLAIMASLLSCHCYRMCRIARRMRQAAELGVTMTGAGSMLSKRTPQSVIEALPVSKYSSIHSQRSAKSPPSSGKQQQQEGAAMPAGGGVGSNSNALVAAAMQLRDQLSRQNGVRSISFGRNSSSITPAAAVAAAAPAGEASHHSLTSNEVQEIVPAVAAAAADAGNSLQDSTSQVSISTAAAAVSDTCSAPDQGSSSGIAAAPLTAPAAAATTLYRASSGKFVNGTSSSNGAEPCAICFEDFTDNDDVKQLPCGHFYHCSCIDEWLVRDVTCPLCKAPVLDEELLEQQQRIAEALEASFGNATARRQQQMERRQRQQRARVRAIILGGLSAADVAAAADTNQDRQQQQTPGQPGDAAEPVPARRSRSAATRDLLELAGLAMLHMHGARAGRNSSRSRGNRSRTTPRQQQQRDQERVQDGAAVDVEMGVARTQDVNHAPRAL